MGDMPGYDTTCRVARFDVTCRRYDNQLAMHLFQDPQLPADSNSHKRHRQRSASPNYDMYAALLCLEIDWTT